MHAGVILVHFFVQNTLYNQLFETAFFVQLQTLFNEWGQTEVKVWKILDPALSPVAPGAVCGHPDCISSSSRGGPRAIEQSRLQSLSLHLPPREPSYGSRRKAMINWLL